MIEDRDFFNDRMEKAEAEVDLLEEICNDYKKQNKELANQVAYMNKDIMTLQAKNQKHKAEIAIWRERNDKQECRIADQDVEIQNLLNALDEIREKVKSPSSNCNNPVYNIADRAIKEGRP